MQLPEGEVKALRRNAAELPDFLAQTIEIKLARVMIAPVVGIEPNITHSLGKFVGYPPNAALRRIPVSLASSVAERGLLR